MKRFSIIAAVFIFVATGYSQSNVDCIINNFQRNGNYYTFDVRANQTSGPAFLVGTSTLTISVNPAAFTYLDVNALSANVTLLNVNPRYTGGWVAGQGNYQTMNRSTLTFSGTPKICRVSINIKHWDGYPGSELLPDELLCTVRLQIFDTTATTGIVWYGSGGLTALAPGSVVNTFVGSDDSALPIALVSFNVNAMNGLAHLQWATLSETNNFGFYVQRGSTRENLTDAEGGFVAGHGTTLSRQEYSWADKSPATYYRLRQVDLDGTSHVSDVIAFTPTNVVLNRDVPAAFALEQNFPNPFNPSTTIRYGLPKASQLKLSVYDMLGCEVAVLVNDRREAGIHEVTYDASSLSSGMYVYRLQAGDVVQSKKFLLVK